MIKRLASVSEFRSDEFARGLGGMNAIARRVGLAEYHTYSRVWEYPWLWTQLSQFDGMGLRLLDTGSERSPFPWFLASRGFNVTVSDVSWDYWWSWQRARRAVGAKVRTRVFDACDISLPAASADVYLSVSVIEHVQDKPKLLREAARVLRPGGLLAMTFDVCEADMGMTFPEWNGHALSMAEFDRLVGDSQWFEQGLSSQAWNTGGIAEYLQWHRTTAAHHNYVTAGAVVRRNEVPWSEDAVATCCRTARRAWGGFAFHLRRGYVGVRDRIRWRLAPASGAARRPPTDAP